MRDTIIQLVLMFIIVSMFTGYYLLNTICDIFNFNPYSSLDYYIVNNTFQSSIIAIVGIAFMLKIIYGEFIYENR